MYVGPIFKMDFVNIQSLKLIILSFLKQNMHRSVVITQQATSPAQSQATSCWSITIAYVPNFITEGELFVFIVFPQ